MATTTQTEEKIESTMQSAPEEQALRILPPKKRRTKVVEYIVIVLCALMMAFGYILFIIPNNFAPAGLNGVATMIQHTLGFSIGYFSLIINIPLCVFAFFFVSREFGIKSLVFSLVYSITYLILQEYSFDAIVYDANDTDTIFPCLIAGMLSGFIYGTCFRMNASTGGTDIVAKTISQKKPTLNFFWVTFVINAAVAFASLFVYSYDKASGVFELDYKPVCLCILYCFLSSFMGSYILRGHKTAYQFMIVTTHSSEIEKEILEKLHHSATRVQGKGIYRNSDQEVLICVINKHQIVDFEDILKKYDQTFAYVQTVNETFGNFKKVKD